LNEAIRVTKVADLHSRDGDFFIGDRAAPVVFRIMTTGGA
jgi:hypothetical protein